MGSNLKMAEQAVLDVLPSGSKIVSFGHHGTPNWASGYKVEAEVEGARKAYYFKVVNHLHHQEIARGEYESQKALQKYLPDRVSIAAAYGTFEDQTSSFFLTPFRNLSLDVPSPSEFADVISTLHTSSVSPTGKFGFHITTYVGHVPVINGWCDTWEEWFTRDFRSDIEWERHVNGADPNFDKLAAKFLEKVVPRLLRPLNVKPVLLHGDLWEGNIKVDMVSGKPVLFDGVCLYGHSELDICLLGRRRGSQLGREHLDAYKLRVPPSNPVEEYEDRLDLYMMRGGVVAAGLWKNRERYRTVVEESMQRLLVKYHEGYSEKGTAAEDCCTHAPGC